MENRYQDDALIINPAIIEIMSREYFDVINKKSKPLESQNQPQNKIFLKKHVHELV